MSAPAQTVSDDPREDCAPCRDIAAERAEWRLRMLEELADIEMRRLRALAQRASAQAAAQQEPAGVPAQGNDLAHSRIARSLRQTLALHAKLEQDKESREKRRAAEGTAKLAETAAAAERERRQRKKRGVRQVIEKVIDYEANDQFHAEALLMRLHNVLEHPDDTDFADRPIPLIIAGICKEIIMYFDRHQWAAEIKAIEAIEAAFAGEMAEATPADAPPASDRPASVGGDASPVATAEESG